ncbi:MAG: hypothetical protein Q4A17_07000 [Thermoguttaceae bacterium]|nr:hypothetical protein [Thermoguttaceae bacterium]
MAWPLSSHFSTMLQTPRVAFKDPVFKNAQILRNAQGQPKPWAGAFAVVYKATLENGENRAVRVFSSESSERRERYEIISQYLQDHPVKCLVNFEYRDNAIRSTDGRWYPLVIMDWVEGHTLFQWVDGQARAGNAKAIRLAADVWAKIVAEMEDAQIAHGDYQQANILVTAEGQMKLVDYDCMCVPALVGRRNLEIGVEPYQHPDRNGDTPLSLTLDRFSALMIYLSLRALAADVSLWQKYVIQTSYDKMMFRKEDIMASQDSELIADLRQSPDEDVRELTEILLRQALGPMDEVPSLALLISPIRRAMPYLQSQQWAEAVDVLKKLQLNEIPTEVKSLVEKAYEEAWKAKSLEDFQNIHWEVNEKCDRMIARVCNDKFLKTFPMPPDTQEKVLAARERILTVDRLYRMMRLAKQNLALSGERSIAAQGALLPPDYEYAGRARVLQAQKVMAIMDPFLEKLNQPHQNEIEIAEAWGNVRKNKLQGLLKDEQRIRAELAVMRAPRIKILESFRKNTPLDQLDQKILSLWDVKLFEGCEQVRKYERLYNIALRRRVKLEMLTEALEANLPEEVAAILKDPLLAHYPLPGPLATKVKIRQEQWTHSEGMIGAMDANDAKLFIEAFDANALIKDPEIYQEIFPQMIPWIEGQILPLETNGLRPVFGRASILNEEDGTVSIRWTWMHPRFGNACVLGVSGGKILDTDRPEDVSLVFNAEITRSQWEKSGSFFTLTPDPAWNGMKVIVWGVIETGFQRFYTQPLILGNLDIKKKSWFKWKK